MGDLGIRQLRQTLAATVRRAKTGERLIITIDGEAVAQLGPIDTPTHEVTVAELIARGLVIAPRRRVSTCLVNLLCCTRVCALTVPCKRFANDTFSRRLCSFGSAC